MGNSLRAGEFRFGFCLHLRDAFQVPENHLLKAWRCEKFGPLVGYFHPETEFMTFRGDYRNLICIGTVYSVVDEAVSAVLRRFGSSQEVQSSILDDLGGRFAIVSIENGSSDVSIYHDAFGSRTVFYSSIVQGIVASHAALLGELLGADPTPGVKDFMSGAWFQSRTVKYLPGDVTLWEEVYSLIPNNFLNIATGKTSRYWPVVPREKIGFDHFFEVYDMHAAGLALSLAKKPVVVGITGGIDTRAVFASFKRHCVEFSGVTWEGNYIEKDEYPVIARLVELLGIGHQYIDTLGGCDEKVAEVAGCNSGGYRGKSRLVAKMYGAYPDRDAVFVRGYGGEIIRGFYRGLYEEDPVKALSVAGLVRAYGSSAKEKSIALAERVFAEKAFEGYRFRANYDGLEQWGYAAADLIYWEHRMGVWGAAMLNEMDVAMLSLVGMNGRRLYQAGLSLDNKERLTKEILLKVIKRYSSEIGDVPYL